MTAGPKIMFVDDDRDFLKAQSAFFGSRGYTVLTAETPEEALTRLEGANQDPDVLVLDLMMGHFDSGFALAHKVRKHERFAKLPIIMLSGVASATGHKFAGDTEQLKNWSTVDAFLDKPVTGRQLLRTVEERLGAKAPGEAQHGD